MGGAARAAYRLHKGLQLIGLDSKMLVQRKQSEDPTVLNPATKLGKVAARVRPILEKWPNKRYKNKTKTYFSSGWVPFSNVVKRINEINPDIVHLHWIADGMFRIEDLRRIKAPIIWSMHDMWAFTGGCHYDGNCGRYIYNCGQCPVLGSDKNSDLSRRIFKRKIKAYAQIGSLTVVGLSRWINKCASQSRLLAGKQVLNLPNPIDTLVFKPLVKATAKEILNLPAGEKIVLFGAVNAIDDPNKGFKELTIALSHIKLHDVEIVVFGSTKPQDAPVLDCPVHYLGKLLDDTSLVVLYSAADVTVVPSLQENLSNVIMESLACGTPVVAFDIGGNSDMIEHRRNGYLAQPNDSADLANGIEWVLQHHSPQVLLNNAVKKINECFEIKKVANQYHLLYKAILNSKDV